VIETIPRFFIDIIYIYIYICSNFIKKSRLHFLFFKMAEKSTFPNKPKPKKQRVSLKKDTRLNINPKKTMVQRKKPQTDNTFNSNKASSSKGKDREDVEMIDFINKAKFDNKDDAGKYYS